MIASLLLSVLPCIPLEPRAEPAPVYSVPGDPQLDAKITAAGKDVAKLLELAAACSTGGQEEDAKKVYAKVIEIDAKNEVAHKALRHQFYDNKWFGSFAELSKYKREEAAKMKGKGLVRFKDEWVPEADAPFLAMGWAKDDDGVWINPHETAREKLVAESKLANKQFRADDNSWIAPADNDKWAAVLWKCGEEWLDTAKANEYHSKIEQPWQIAGERFIVWTTCDWDGGTSARWHADKTHADLVRLFGIEPKVKPHFAVLRSLEQYNQAAGGNPPLLPDSEGFSSLHGAYFADVLFDVDAKPPEFIGCGVSYWDRKDPKAATWGPLWLRWAAAQSFVDAIDPSWGAISERIGSADGELGGYAAAFWGEKKIPRWLRYGAASYVERFWKNPDVAEGADPWELRGFSFAAVKKSGGLPKLEDVFAFGIGLEDPDKSARLYDGAGLLVAFLLDGAPNDKNLAKKHEAFKTALKSGSKEDVAKAVDGLQKELAKNESDIKKFAGL